MTSPYSRAPHRHIDPTEPPPNPPAFNVPPVTLGLTGLLTAIFAVLQVAGPGIRQSVLLWLSLIPIRISAAVEGWLGLESLLAAATLVTHAVLHLDLLHFLVNAGFLLAFGSAAERTMGAGRYGWLLLASALGGAAAQLAVSWGDELVMFGASGVVSGCMGGVVRLMLSRTAPPRQRRTALNLIGAFLLINLLFALFGGGIMGVDADIAWAAHVGGFAAGFAVGRRRRLDILI
ncbi:MAG TPA: rhomboid family intramembrane serine protease [Alphaproteobacteria bacterium]|nr:rhomboid family intramembrane serine protease [Alphaproteobacteria bacterium]